MLIECISFKMVSVCQIESISSVINQLKLFDSRIRFAYGKSWRVLPGTSSRL